MHAFFTKLIKDQSGVTAIEYGLIAALIAVAAVTIMGTGRAAAKPRNPEAIRSHS